MKGDFCSILKLFDDNYSHSFQIRSGLRPGFRVLTGSPSRSGQIFFKKSKRCLFSKKQQKSMGYNRVFLGHSGRRVSRVTSDFFFSYFFSTQPGFIPGSRIDPLGRAGFQNYSYNFIYNTSGVIIIYQKKQRQKKLQL